uniref:Uncharacterized protein n=1 Tax=Anguilla anguilla TaxID=7936 RepID=A0A0E9TC85_ANGAN
MSSAKMLFDFLGRCLGFFTYGFLDSGCFSGTFLSSGRSLRLAHTKFNNISPGAYNFQNLP